MYLKHGGNPEDGTCPDAAFSRVINRKYPDFEIFLEKYLRGNRFPYIHFLPQTHFIFHKEPEICEKVVVFKLEEADAWGGELSRMVGRVVDMRQKMNVGPVSLDYREVYSRKAREMIEEYYRVDIDRFNYTFQ